MAIAKISGTAMAPGVSLNGRLYTADLIGRAVERAQERLKSGEPLTMLTHHGAEDDSTRIVGRVTSIKQAPDGSARFTAELADTAHGRDLATLTSGEQPYLDAVSIRGWWLGDVRQEEYQGATVETADDIELDGIDFTKTPGVLQARLDRDRAARESTPGRVLVYESVAVDAPRHPAPVKEAFADLGYRGVRRYPLHTREFARRSWHRINTAAETSGYTPAQLKRIRSRIKAALKEHGVVMPEAKTRFDPVKEFYADGVSGGDAGLSICAYNGPLSLTVSAYGINADQVQLVADAAMAAAMDALAALDGITPDEPAEQPEDEAEPEDEPADDEAPFPDDENDDEQMETTTRPGAVAEKRPRTRAAATTRREPTVAPKNEAATEAAPGGITLTQEQFNQLLAAARGGAATEAAPAEPVVQETAEEKQARIIAEAVAKGLADVEDRLRADIQAAGPRRIGRPTTKTLESLAATPDKPLHEMATEDFNKMAEKGLAAALGVNLDQ